MASLRQRVLNQEQRVLNQEQRVPSVSTCVKMETDTPLQEDPRNQADESHLRDCAGAGAQLGAVGGQGAMQNLHLPSHSPRFALPASISCELIRMPKLGHAIQKIVSLSFELEII